MTWIRLALIALPLVEIALFVEIGSRIGAWATIGLVLLAAVAGVLLLRGGGMLALAQVRAALREGRDPGAGMLRGGLVLLAALLLIVPGFFSDAVALVLLLPPVQRLVARRLRGDREAGDGRDGDGGGFRGGSRAGGRAAHDMVIEGEFTELGPEEPGDDRDGRRPPSGWTRHDGA